MTNSPFITEPTAVLAVLLAVLAGLFALARQRVGARFFRAVPILVFVYFVPTTLSNLGVIPLESATYDWIKSWLLPASLMLLTMSVDIPAILKLGRNVLLLFLAGTVSVVLGGPLAYWLLRGLVPVEMGDQAWKGLAALSGSWIGGGANFIAIGESVGATTSTLGLMIVVDVALANAWMAILLFFAANEDRLDAAVRADRRTLDEVKQRLEHYRQQVVREMTLADLCTICSVAFGATVSASYVAGGLPALGGVLNHFAWTVILVTAAGVAASFTPLRAGRRRCRARRFPVLVPAGRLDRGSGRISARAGCAALLLIASVWIAIHAVTLLIVRYWLKAPIFFLAVGSQANIGGAASAPIVAAAFQPELASVGALMGVAGYVLGTYGGLLCAYLMRWVYLLG